MKITPSPFEKEYKYCPSCRGELKRKVIDRRNLLVCPKCGFIFWNNPKPVTSVLLERDGKVLMLQRKQEPLKNYWVLPGGFINYEETPKQAAIREAKEETGLKVKIDQLLDAYRIEDDPRGIHIEIVFKGTILSDEFSPWCAAEHRPFKNSSLRSSDHNVGAKGDIRLNEESSRFEFFPLNKLPRLIAYQHRRVILDWQKKRG